MLKPDRFSCSQKIWLKRDPPVIVLEPFKLHGPLINVTILSLAKGFTLKQIKRHLKCACQESDTSHVMNVMTSTPTDEALAI